MQKHAEFTCLSISPIDLSPPGIALATARAGGVGILDHEYCHGGSLVRAVDNLRWLLGLTPRNQRIGLRLALTRLDNDTVSALLEPLSQRDHWLILCRWQPDGLAQQMSRLPSCAKRRTLLEVSDAAQISGLSAMPASIDGLVAKGSESGGWVGGESAFVLAQKLLSKSILPVYVQGGIGVYTAAACRAGGAAGVVAEASSRLSQQQCVDHLELTE